MSMRILIVDDSRSVHAFIKAALPGHEFQDAFDGAEATRILEGTPPFDLIFLDWEMPLMSGIDCLIALRGRGVETKVVMVTSKNGVEDIAIALDKGANDYVMKPFTADILRERLSMLGIALEAS